MATTTNKDLFKNINIYHHQHILKSQHRSRLMKMSPNEVMSPTSVQRTLAMKTINMVARWHHIFPPLSLGNMLHRYLHAVVLINDYFQVKVTHVCHQKLNYTEARVHLHHHVLLHVSHWTLYQLLYMLDSLTQLKCSYSSTQQRMTR